MTCKQLLRPFDRAHVGVSWMLAAGIITAAALFLSGCADVAAVGGGVFICAVNVCN